MATVRQPFGETHQGAAEARCIPVLCALPEKLTRYAHFARCKDYLEGVDARTQSGAILALLDEEVYDLARSLDISEASTPSFVLNGVREIFGSSEHPWVLQLEFQRRFQ
ncbi:unnamed protein product [Schistocephalus solidus]|uniref:Band_3_cyto domain-containing protein n=1 Tax=Schistocephalus solidus TaxID=70667 RepID=A0A183SZP9_SCHSO|nr:unnamed protein product [Schistocephalus solidus]